MQENYWFIGGRAYDLRPFLAAHPGGKDAILLGQGTNCTELFKSYHFTKLPTAMLAKYEVAVDRDDPAIAALLDGTFTFADAEFYRTIQKRVHAHLVKTNRGRAWASPLTQAMSVLSILSVIALTYPAFVRGSIAAAVVLGVVKALTSVGPGHSMSHLSLFPRGRWNAWAFRIAAPFMVSSWAIWSATHVKSHHVHTLTLQDAQDNYPLKRVQTAMAHHWWHRGQHVYIWLIYLLGLPLWTLQDFLVSLTGGNHAGARFTFQARLLNIATIGFNLVFSVGLPFVFLPWKHALLVSLVANVISSWMVVTQIVVNHEVTGTESAIPAPGAGGGTVDWGVHQVKTSHNYRSESLVALHMSGGLNLQIEHHLFPNVHYTHFREVQKIVQAACLEFGLPYRESRTYSGAIAAHYQLLKANSVPDAGESRLHASQPALVPFVQKVIPAIAALPVIPAAIAVAVVPVVAPAAAAAASAVPLA